MHFTIHDLQKKLRQRYVARWYRVDVPEVVKWLEENISEPGTNISAGWDALSSISPKTLPLPTLD
jgi:hypothetical protein